MLKRTRNEGRILRRDRGRKKIAGSADRPRLSVFFSNRQVYAQLINDMESKTIASASTIVADVKTEAKEKPMTEMAKMVGKKIAEAGKAAGVTTVVFDKSGYKYGKRLSALADAAREAGLQF